MRAELKVDKRERLAAYYAVARYAWVGERSPQEVLLMVNTALRAAQKVRRQKRKTKP